MIAAFDFMITKYYIKRTNGLLYRVHGDDVEVYNTDWSQSGYMPLAFEGPAKLSFFDEVSEEKAKVEFPMAFLLPL